MVALLKDDSEALYAAAVGAVHPRWDRRDPARPSDHAPVVIPVDEPLLAAAVAQARIIAASGQMRNLAGRINNPRTQIVGKLGELAVVRYYRQCGIAADLVAYWDKEAGMPPYDPVRDDYDVLIAGWRKLEVKTVHRTVPLQPHYLAHLNRTRAYVRSHDLFAFCSFYSRDDGQGGSEDVIEFAGYLSGGDILRMGTYARKGDCLPDDPFPQRADNFCLPYAALHHPYWLYGNDTEPPYADILRADLRAQREEGHVDPLRHIGVR